MAQHTGSVEAARWVESVCTKILLNVEVKSHAGLLRCLFYFWHSLFGFGLFDCGFFLLLSKHLPSRHEVVARGLQTCLEGPDTLAIFPSGAAECVLAITMEKAGFKGNNISPLTLDGFYAAVSVFRSCEKKQKVSEDLPKAEGTCEKGGHDCGEFSCVPLDDKPLSEQLKELDAGNGEEQSVTSNSVPLDTGKKNVPGPSWSLGTGDQKVNSTGTRAPHWDFTTIFLPNVAPDQPCIHLPSPDNKLLPENVPGREVDAASWCRRINQKQEKLLKKEREQQEKESKYKSSINSDREVRCCINWQEYKALLRRRSQQRVWRRPPHLWGQAVTPLLQPEEATSFGRDYGRLPRTQILSACQCSVGGLFMQQQKGDLETLSISLGE